MTKKKAWYIGAMSFDVEPLPSCCGISVVRDIFLDPWDHDEWDTKLNGYNRTVKLHKLTQQAVSSEIKRMTTNIATGKYQPAWSIRILNPVKAFILTITDKEKKDFKFYDKALTTHGWAMVNKSKTAHKGADYSIYMYVINFKETKAKHAV